MDRNSFARLFSVADEKFFIVQNTVIQRQCFFIRKFFEKIFWWFVKWLYLCIRFRRKNGG